MRQKDGRRDLSLIRASGSTARVLNLALAFERFGETEDFIKKPLFRNPRLNRALILKHVVRQHERELFTRPTTTATKVNLPYAAQELELGGISFMVNEVRFERLLKDAVGGYLNDVDLLALDEALDRLAKLNPAHARLVELRFFGGLSVEEAAGIMGQSVRSLHRDWRVAKAWLNRELTNAPAEEDAQ